MHALPKHAKNALKPLGAGTDGRLQQIEDIKAAVLAADGGEFASDVEVSTVFAKYMGSTERGCGPRTSNRTAT